jgi:hypothetical protein
MGNFEKAGTRIALVFLCAGCLVLFCSHNGGDWLDMPGITYRCPGCADDAVVHAIGECDRCGGVTTSMSYKYCYDCAKELDCCQMCGMPRRLLEPIP